MVCDVHELVSGVWIIYPLIRILEISVIVLFLAKREKAFSPPVELGGEMHGSLWYIMITKWVGDSDVKMSNDENSEDSKATSVPRDGVSENKNSVVKSPMIDINNSKVPRSGGVVSSDPAQSLPRSFKIGRECGSGSGLPILIMCNK